MTNFRVIPLSGLVPPGMSGARARNKLRKAGMSSYNNKWVFNVGTADHVKRLLRSVHKD